MKSMCQDPRRNSPSVTVRSPASRCSAITSSIGGVLEARSSAASIVPAARSSRACSSGRRAQQAADVVGAERRGVTEHGSSSRTAARSSPPWHADGRRHPGGWRVRGGVDIEHRFGYHGAWLSIWSTELDPSATLAGWRWWCGAGGRSRSTTCCWSRTGASCSPPTRATTPGRTRPCRDRRAGTGWSGSAGTAPRRVRELTLCELGIARGVHMLSARAVAADVLDLRHRLPLTWAVFLSGRCDAWLARRVASLTREPGSGRGGAGRRAAAAAIAGEAPGPGAGDRGGQDHRGRPRRPRGAGRGRAATPLRVPDPDRRAPGCATSSPGSPPATRPTSTPSISRVADILATRPRARRRPPRRAPLARVRLAGPPRRAPHPAPRAHRHRPRHRTAHETSPTDADDRARRTRADAEPSRNPSRAAPPGAGVPRRPARRPAPDRPRPAAPPGGASTSTCTRPLARPPPPGTGSPVRWPGSRASARTAWPSSPSCSATPGSPSSR